MKTARHIFLLGVVLSLFWLLAGCQPGDSLQTTTGEPTFELSVDILGRTQAISLDAEGRLTINAKMASSDGTVILVSCQAIR